MRYPRFSPASLRTFCIILTASLCVCGPLTSSPPESFPDAPPRGYAEIAIGAGALNAAGVAGGPRIAVTIFTPRASAVRGDILVLPGWNFNRARWLNETPLVAEAERRGYRLIAPEMGVTLYESQYFPETTLRWAPLPGRQWLRERMLPELQRRGVLRPGAANFLLGLSTGGRGVALLALDFPELWAAASALSGDFDQTRMRSDRLMTRLYGPYARFTERWATVDNPEARAAEFRTPLYLAHGKSDRVVPFSESAGFYASLRAARPDLKIVFADPDAGHDFAFWGAQVRPSLDFFDQHLPR